MKIRLLVIAMSLSVITGCVRFDLDKSLAQSNEDAGDFTSGNLKLLLNEEQRTEAQARAAELLNTELDQSAAIELAMVNSPAVQAMLAEHWAQSSAIAVSASIPNPVFEFSRLSSDSELEIERLLAIGLLDLIRLPMLSKNANLQLQGSQLSLTADTVELVTMVRQAWVNAVATQELSRYAEQVFSSAEASATLAAGMQAIGNFNALSRARQQSFYADAATNLTLVRHNALAAREALIRLLGLNQQQATLLKLPNRLPDLPDSPVSPEDVASVSTDTRLDVNLAIGQVQMATRQQGIKLLSEVTDIEIAGIRNTVWGDDERETITGYELDIELPIFTSIRQVRNQLNASSLAATSNLETITRSAVSHMRESYSAYRSSYDVATHYRDEVVPLQQLVSEENVLNYNGMIIGVFELLADSRAQIETVQSSIEAAAQFWMADAALRATMVGKPTTTMMAMSGGGDSGGGQDH